MTDEHNLERFATAQKNDYQRALSEIENGRKQSHWMWYIFPQIAGLGFSPTSKTYAIRNLAEAESYLNHAILGARLVEITRALSEIEGKTAHQIFGSPDDLKLKSSMTLFGALENTNPVFQKALDKYFDGEKDRRTLEIIESQTKIQRLNE